LSIVVVTHESEGDIAACLESALTSRDDVSRELIVVDNASSDDTVDIVAGSFPEARLVRKRGRHGFALNSNIGVVASRGRHVLLLNPDAVVHEGTLRHIVDYLDEHPWVGAVGPRLVYPDGSPQASARRFPTPLTTVLRRTPVRTLFRSVPGEDHHLMLDVDLDHPRNVDWILGAAMALRVDALRQLGGLDDGYRLYCEDIDLCWRLHERGWQVRYLPQPTVEHKLAERTRKRFLTRATVWHFWSMVRFVRLHGFGPIRAAAPVLPLPLPVSAPTPVSSLALAEVE